MNAADSRSAGTYPSLTGSNPVAGVLFFILESVTRDMTTVNVDQGIKIKNGIGLVSSGGGYTLYIPELNISDINQLHSEFESNFSYKNEFELAEELVYFLYERLDYDGFSKAGDSLDLEAAINLEKGVCKEMAAILQILFQRFGIDSYYHRGRVHREDGVYGHAWVKAKIGDQIFYSDSTWGVFKPYQAV